MTSDAPLPSGLQAEDIRVLLVDDDPFITSSLATILNAAGGVSVAGTCQSAEEAIRLFGELQPDILLMDIRMPLTSGLEAASIILKDWPEARIVFLTTFADDEYIATALRLGAKGYLIKHDVSAIAPALRLVAGGQSVLGGEVLERTCGLLAASESGASERAAEEGRMSLLSERELSIARKVAEGLDNREIASELFIGEGTVRNHVSTILTKLDLKNRTQLAILYYRELGLPE